MKKTNFWKGLALAAVALVGVYTTSCSEEELKIQGGTITIPNPEIPELAEPVINVAITVLDFESYQVLKSEVVKIENSKMGQTISVSCPEFEKQSEYTTAKDININIPTIGKGQAIVIPVTFYVVPMQSALKDVIKDLYEDGLPVDENAEAVKETLVATAEGELAIKDGVIVNEGDEAVKMTINIPYKSGYEFRGANSRAISAEDITNLKAEQKIYKLTITVLPGTAVTITANQVKTPVILTIDGVEFKLWFFEDLQVNVDSQSLSHDNDHDGSHDHGHGNGNAGGGIGEAE